MEILVGLDPSFHRTGIAIYVNNKIIVSEVKITPNPNKSFEQIYRDVMTQKNNIMREINDILMSEKVYLMEGLEVLSECPPPQGNFAPGLYALDVSIFSAMRREGWGVYRVYPTYLGHVHGKRKYSKSESVELAKEILSFYPHEIKSKRLSHDEAEAVIFLARNMAKHCILNTELMAKYEGLNSEKEVEL